jgi:hypothetical protein
MVFVEKSVRELNQEIHSLALQAESLYALGAMKALEWVANGGIPPSMQLVRCAEILVNKES